jgi:hypothetical protein
MRNLTKQSVMSGEMSRPGTESLMQRLMDSNELSELIVVPPRTLDSWAYRGIGPAYVRVGKYRRYRVEDVERWLADNVRGGVG